LCDASNFNILVCHGLDIDPGWLEVLHVKQDYARYGVQSLEDKQKLFRLIKTISSSGVDSVSEPSTPPAYSRSASQSGMDGFLSPELRGDFNSGILDLHSIDDTEFFPEVI
jgi:kinesin family protein 2/24